MTSKFFTEAESINQLNELRQELLTSISEEYKEAVERIRAKEPKFKRMRVIEVSQLIEQDTPIYGLFISTKTSVRSPRLRITESGVNY